MRKLYYIIQLLRPLNAMMSVIGSAIGYFLSHRIYILKDILFILLSTFCAVGFGNVINDIKDIEGDKINHPNRPLPAGKVKIRTANILLTLLMIFSLLFAYNVSVNHFIGALLPVFLLIIYTFKLKSIPFAGNTIISILVGYTLIYGAINSNYKEIIYLPSLLAFLLNMSREIIKDLEDKQGDLATGIKTTASIPLKTIKKVIFLLWIFYCIIFSLPYVLNHYGIIYLVICIVIILPVHIRWYYLFTIKKQYTKASSLIKIEMFIGLLALIIDQITNVA